MCSAARRDMCLRFPFDETVIMSEDQIFAKALLSAGFQTVYNAEIAVIHSHHYSLRTLFRRNFDSAWSLRGVTHDGGLRTLRRAVGYVLGEAAFVIRRRRWRWLLYVVPYEAVRTAGRLCGIRADSIPLRWRRALSLHRGYWSRETLT
jgi:rhamnosyltransferase